MRHASKSLISNVLVTHVTEMTPSDFFSWLESIITMSNTQGAVWPTYADRKEGSNHGS